MNQFPDNFSFIDEVVAGSSYPYTIEHLQAFVDAGIRYIISLNTNSPKALIKKAGLDDKLTVIHSPTYSVPHPESLAEFHALIRDKVNTQNKVVVHCQYGQERTGMILASYLVNMHNMPVSAAIQKIQELRPGSLQSGSSRTYLHDLYGK